LISYAPILAAFLSCALVFLAACEGPIRSERHSNR